MNFIIKVIGISLPILIVWSLNFNPLSPSLFRPLIILLSAVLILGVFKSKHRWFDISLMIISVVTFWYAIQEVEGILGRGGIHTTSLDLIFGTLAILLVLEITRRTVGIALPIVTIAFLLYALFGEFIPGNLGHGGYSYNRIITTLFTYDGMFGTPIAVTVTFVAMFIVFAAILNLTGVGDVFLNLSKSVAGSYRGGPAKMATIASGLFGSISGSAVANVAATGSLTIPMMKRLGYSKTYSGAIEAAASTGGQFMPPVMAAGAFLMAEILGVPYLEVMYAALIPSIIFFVTIWFSIDFRSAKLGLKGLSKDEIPSWRKLLINSGYLLTPLVILIIMLVVFQYSPIRAAFYSLISSIILSFIKKETRPNLKTLGNSLFEASKGLISIVAPVAAAGLVIGVIGLTGLGGKVASLVIGMSGGSILLALVLSMITAIIFGMGLPTTVSYLLVVSILAPVLSELGVIPIAAHLFIFYFASLSGITPPVGLAAFTGANIAGSPPIRTAFMASRLAIAAFILPFLFVFNNSLLMMGNWFDIILSAITAIISVMALAAALEGWFITNLNVWERIFLLMVALLLIYPSYVTDILGVFAVLGVFLYKKNHNKQKKEDIGEIDDSYSVNK
ncbi:TRAP transporter permease [Oceanobacillus oncorhynchi]|uniref:TRAP transporter permease n=1 Tax=Oceanobacillus oncorhynchi TaxID=545501 RepID=UPI002F968BB8